MHLVMLVLSLNVVDDANVFMGYDESVDRVVLGTGSFTGASSGDLTITSFGVTAAHR